MELVKRSRDSCIRHLIAVLEAQRTPFTQNTHKLEIVQDKWLAKYKDARARNGVHFGSS